MPAAAPDPSSRGPSRRAVLLLSAVGVAAIAAYFVWQQVSSRETPFTSYEIVNEFPHDPRAYTQGLVIHEGALYEGTGKYGESTIRQLELETGKVLSQWNLDRRYFGEGITVWGDHIIQLTWRERVALIVDRATLRPTGDTFRYQGEGWGLTTDGESLIMSDGTSVLRFLDPRTFRVRRRLIVQDQRRRLKDLNELEYVNGEIFANVWKKDYIARISPRTGAVTGKIDLSALKRRLKGLGSDDVLNGIAYDADQDRLFVTGKNWPSLFEIRLIE